MKSAFNQLLKESPIVITGMGCFTAAGVSVDELMENVLAGKPSAQTHPDFSKPACRAPEIDVRIPDLRFVRRMDRSVQMAWIAAQQAWTGASVKNVDAERIGISVGTSRGPLHKSAESFARAGDPRFPPSLGADSTFGVAAGALAHGFGIKGPGVTLSATCASAANAIAFAAEQILLGKAEMMLAGGTEAPLHSSTFSQLDAAGVLGSHPDAAFACRPFDRNRNGMVLGEGAAFLVLELLRSAQARGAKPLARLAGWASGFDLSGRTGVDEAGAGLIQVMREALSVADLSLDDIDYINAHGTGTAMNDRAEAAAVKSVFGERAVHLPCSSTKPVTGHCLGATPAIEAIIGIETIRRQQIPPTATCHNPDPLCAIDAVPQIGRAGVVRTTMSNSLGFWGCHAALIFSAL
jgi:3-oxoacyl-(acyl-carrier-protein) synthase